MDAIAIEVPDMNDSVSKVTLARYAVPDTLHLQRYGGLLVLRSVRFLGQSYPNWRKDCPSIPSQPVLGRENTPLGVFGALSEQDSIGRKDFIEGRAKFIFIPA